MKGSIKLLVFNDQTKKRPVYYVNEYRKVNV
jgi:hypothetical protein